MNADEIRARLNGERDRLQALRDDEAGLSQESEQDSLSELSSADQHPADVGTETFNRERDLSILEQVEAELADVDHALHRLEDGTYGTCEICGAPIGDERLEAMPATRYCIEHEAQVERDARIAGENQ